MNLKIKSTKKISLVVCDCHSIGHEFVHVALPGTDHGLTQNPRFEDSRHHRSQSYLCIEYELLVCFIFNHLSFGGK